MAMPPGRWVGYALIVAGLSLLYDTYTFLRTNWSPLHVPMYAPSELELGYLLIAGGLVFLLAPTFLHMLDDYAPDYSLKMGEGLAYESVELRRRRRLPLKKRLSLLPNLGLIGGPVFLVLLIIMILLNSPRESRGIYVRLTPQRGWGPNENCLAGPIVVTINQYGSLSRLLLNGSEVSREEFERALKSKLAKRADWEVFVDGDDAVSFADPLYAIDIVNDLHAKAMILTPKLRQQIAEKGCPPR